MCSRAVAVTGTRGSPTCQGVLWQGNADGAYFGTTFPHLLLMTYPALRPPRPTETYVPRVFGFKLHASAMERETPAAGPSSSAAGPSKPAGGADNQPRKNHGADAAGTAAVVAASDRRGKRREDEQGAGAQRPARNVETQKGQASQEDFRVMLPGPD